MDTKSLIPAELSRWISELLSGARIEKISTDSELVHSVELLRKTKQTLADLEADKEAKVDPLYREYKTALAVYTEKIDALKGLAKNLGNKGAEYQLELQRIAAEEQRRRELEAEEKRRELARIEQKRIDDEEALRSEALAAQAVLNNADADQYLTTEERAALIDRANIASELADIAMTEATQAAVAQSTVQVAPVQEAYRPAGFKAKVDYSARVTDPRAFLTWIVMSREFAYIESAALTKALESAANKIAKNRQREFKIPGCSLIETAASSVRY